jgi:hypothetical protein
MTLKPFGELVTAPDVERLPEDAGPTHFVRVCGALIRWALVEHGAASADLQIAERLNVPDRGADAECALPDTTIETGGFVGPGRTIFQFKYRDVGAADRRAIVSSLAARLREELRNLPAGCDRYVLMTNVSLAGTQPSRLREAIAAGAPALTTKIIIWGAAEIANALNASPGLRHLFAAAGGLSTLDVAEAELQAAYRKVGWAPFVNRARELSALRDFIESDTARVLRVQGPRFSGRTRLVIEAVKQWAPSALWAVSAEHVDVDLLRDLDSDRGHQLLVVDDDDDEAARRVLDWAEQRQRLKTIVIARGTERHPGESDPGCLDVPEMERSEVEKLLRSFAPGLPFAEQSWIIEGARGLPGLVAHVAALVAEPRLRAVNDPEEFRRRLGDVLTERYEVDLDPGARQTLQIASLLPVLGVEGAVAAEVAAIARALDIDPGVFAAHRLALERAGFLRRRGRFVEVVPPLLAEHLATRALTNPDRVVAELQLVLSEGRFLALLDRLARVPGEGLRTAIERTLWERCAGFDGLRRNSEVIHKLAPAAPRTAIRCIEEGLRNVTVETLAETLKGEERRALVWTLENLAFRSETFESAAGQLLALAEAENETSQNNATGVFLSLFHWGHPELPATLSQRLAVLKQGATSGTAGRRKIVADAAGAAFKEREVFRLHHPSGPHLPEPRYRPETWEEVGNYGLGVIEVLELLWRDTDIKVRASAGTAVTQVFRPVILVSLRLARPSEGMLPVLALKAFKTLAGVGQAAESAPTYQAVATALELLPDSLKVAATEKRAVAAELTRRAIKMEADLMRSFRGRLWRVIGPASWGQRRRWRAETEERREAIRGIATLILEDPNYPALFVSHRDWLTGSEARSGDELFHALGKSDSRRGVLSSLIAGEITPLGEERLTAYLTGWAEDNGEAACAETDHLIASRSDLDRALLATVARLFRGPDLVERVRRLFTLGALERHEFATLLASLLSWEALTAPETEELATMVDDGTPRVRGTLLVVFAVRLMRGGELTSTLREQAWSFLESSSRLEEAHSNLWWDQLAAQLGEMEPQRLLALVEDLGIQATKEDRGRAALHHEIPLSLETLRKADRPGFIQMLLRLASYPDQSWRIEAAVEEEIDPLVDRETLLAFAREAGVEGARTVALNLSAEKPGFWEVAHDLLIEWGGDETLRQRLLSALSGDGWSGSAVPMITERLDKATALRSDPSPLVASWAQEVVSFFEGWRRREVREEQEDWIWDYRIRRAEMEGMVRGPDSPEKLWAIGRLLEHAPRERVLELVTPEEILDALDKIPQLPERVRERWEPWAKHWAGRH